MKKLSLLFLSLLLSTQVFAQSPNAPQQDQRQQVAKQGCQKPIGYFPTPAKILCVLSATGLSEKNIKAKELALIFSACKGYALQPSENKPVTYKTLGTCLKDPSAIDVINRELKAQGFQPLTIVNPKVLAS